MADSEHTGFTRRTEREPEDALEVLRKKVIDNRYKGVYSIDGNELLGIIERLQTAERTLKGLDKTT